MPEALGGDQHHIDVSHWKRDTRMPPTATAATAGVDQPDIELEAAEVLFSASAMAASRSV